MRGRFIVFEGIDGAGKSTQIARLADRLRAEGKVVYCTAEPTESVTGGLLRDALGGVSNRSACEMAALFVLDRIFHNVNPVNGIQKMLADGVDVICDRYYYSSLAYQGSEIEGEWVRRMNLDCPDVLRPDGCIFFDMDPAASMARIRAGRSDEALEIYETVAQQECIRARYARVRDYLADRDLICTVNADGTVDEVADRVWEAYCKIRHANNN